MGTAVFFGATPPRRNQPKRARRNSLPFIMELLTQIDPDVHYGDWIRVLMVIFYESGGSEEGFDIANEWSSQGYKYKGEREIRYKWSSFDLNHKHPITLATLVNMVKHA